MIPEHNRRYPYAVRFYGEWSPDLLVWATESKAAVQVARQTDMGEPTGAVEMHPPVAWMETFGRRTNPDQYKHCGTPMPVLYGAGEGFFHRIRGKVYRMTAGGTHRPL